MRTLTLALTLTLAAFAQDKADETARWIDELDAYEVEARERAESKLVERGRPALSALRKAVATAQGDLKTRLEHVIRSITEPRWNDLVAAIERARREKKPLLVFSTVGDRGGYL